MDLAIKNPLKFIFLDSSLLELQIEPCITDGQKKRYKNEFADKNLVFIVKNNQTKTAQTATSDEGVVAKDWIRYYDNATVQLWIREYRDNSSFFLASAEVLVL